jgi:hypothetical protein
LRCEAHNEQMYRRVAWIVASVGLAASADTALASPAAVRVSSNWAGYAVSARSATGPTMGSFTGVSGSWVVPLGEVHGGPDLLGRVGGPGWV